MQHDLVLSFCALLTKIETPLIRQAFVSFRLDELCFVLLLLLQKSSRADAPYVVGSNTPHNGEGGYSARPHESLAH
jgi:hypothetical protein